MTDATQRRLKSTVERAVRPVRVSFRRKRAMREELFAHLSAIYEEENTRQSGNTAAAFESARRRFGDPKLLSQELQQTVSRGDRLRALNEFWIIYSPGESALRFASKCSLAALLAYALFCVLPIEAVVTIANWFGANFSRVTWPALFVCGGITAAFLFILMLFSIPIARALYGSPDERSPLRAITLSVISLAALPTLALSAHWLLTGELSLGFDYIVPTCGFAILFPVVLVGMARQLGEELRHADEWASMEIDP